MPLAAARSLTIMADREQCRVNGNVRVPLRRHPCARHRREIGSGFAWERLSAIKRGRIAGRPGVVGAEEAGIAEAVVHGPQIGSTRQNIVVRIVRIAPQMLDGAHFRPGLRHELHEPDRPRGASDGTTIERGAPSALRLQNARDSVGGKREPLRRFVDQGLPGRWHRMSGGRRRRRREQRRGEHQRGHSRCAFPITSACRVAPK